MDLKKIIDYQKYKMSATPEWPSYNELINGNTGSNDEIEKQVNNFLNKSLAEYQNLMTYSVKNSDEIAKGNQFMQGQTFFDKKVITERHCDIPWNTLGVNSMGDVYICLSPAWIPRFAGNLLETKSIYDILNSETAQLIRQEILAGRYYYCNNNLCRFFANAKRYKTYQPNITDEKSTEALSLVADDRLLVKQIPGNLIFDFDHTCNFKCPSCRTELINYNKHFIVRENNNRIAERIKTEIIDRIDDQPVEIRWAGGEPFISEVYLDLFDYIIKSEKHNIKHIIQTNGSYLKNKRELVERFAPHLSELRISFDAATADTYSKIRVNGQWHVLLDNVQWIVNFVKENNLPVKITADFVVQKANYKEIPEFTRLCNNLGIFKINYQRMWNWSTWTTEEFNELNVFAPTHPEYSEVVRLLKQVNDHDFPSR
jgi:sulfatase maturation enzyme AslB (radical SAM superfamily)